MIGVCRVFIKDFAKKAEPLEKLKRLNVQWEWGPEQEAAMEELKDLLENCPALKPIDYEMETPVVLAVDTSWKAVGFYIYQEEPGGDKKKQRSARFGSITLNKREARFSQPKRELFGLMRALEANKHWLLG